MNAVTFAHDKLLWLLLLAPLLVLVKMHVDASASKAVKAFSPYRLELDLTSGTIY